MVCVSNLVLRGIRLVPRTCFRPQQTGSFDVILAKRILRAEDKSDRVCGFCGWKMKALHQFCSFLKTGGGGGGGSEE